MWNQSYFDLVCKLCFYTDVANHSPTLTETKLFYNDDVYKKKNNKEIHAAVPRRQYTVLSGKNQNLKGQILTMIDMENFNN